MAGQVPAEWRMGSQGWMWPLDGFAPARAYQGTDPFTGPHPVSFTPQPPPFTPHRGQDSTCECWGTQTSSLGSMSTPTKSLSGRCPSCPTQPDGSCADLPGGGQNRRPSHLHAKPSFSAQSENCNPGAAVYCVRTFSTEPPGGDLTGRCRVRSGSGSGGVGYRVRATCRVRVMSGSCQGQAQEGSSGRQAWVVMHSPESELSRCL